MSLWDWRFDNYLIVPDKGTEPQNCVGQLMENRCHLCLHLLFHLPSPISPACWVWLQYIKFFLSSPFPLILLGCLSCHHLTRCHCDTSKLTYLILILDVPGNSAPCFLANHPKHVPFQLRNILWSLWLTMHLPRSSGWLSMPSII